MFYIRPSDLCSLYKVRYVPGPDDWKQNIANVENLRKAIDLVNERVELTGTRIDINQNAITKLHKDLDLLVGTLDHEMIEINYLKDGLKLRLLFASVEKDALKILELVESIFFKLELVMVMGRHQFASKLGIDQTFLLLMYSFFC